MYQNADVPPPVVGDWSQDAKMVPAGFRAASTYVAAGCERFSAETLLDMRRAYYACITQIDYNLGRLFARMRELDVLDNTLILFTSDHGEMLGDHHICAKSLFLEGAAHVPMLLRPPVGGMGDEERGRVCDELVCPVDVYATCLGAAGVAPPERYETDSLDLRRVARGESQRDVFFGVCRGLWQYYAIIRGKHKYTYCADGASELLFDLSVDPYEQHDLASNPAHEALKEELQGALIAEIAEVRPEYLVDGQLPVRDTPDLESFRGGWPGFHSRECPEDVMH